MNNDEVEIKVWIHRPPMYVNAYALEPDDPDSVYNQIIAQGKDPLDYGFPDPYEMFKDMSRLELCKALYKAKKDLETVEIHMAGC